MGHDKYLLCNYLCSQWLKWKVLVPKTCVAYPNQSILVHIPGSSKISGKSEKFETNFGRFRLLWRSVTSPTRPRGSNIVDFSAYMSGFFQKVKSMREIYYQVFTSSNVINFNEKNLLTIFTSENVIKFNEINLLEVS